MTITREQTGVSVHLDAAECDLLMRLAADAETAADELHATFADHASDYFSLSVALGRRIRALAASGDATATDSPGDRRAPMARAMVDLILSPDPI